MPATVLHADWSVDAAKRMVAAAVRTDGGGYRATAPKRAEDADELSTLTRQRGGCDDEPLLAGFDFPIGVPRAWASAVGVADFRDLLTGIGEGRWRDFANVADTPDAISLERPFYPQRGKGGPRRTELTSALELEWDDLYRRCDRGSTTREPAAPLFWTVGAKQVGKAALHGWTHVLKPALAEGDALILRLWPFDTVSMTEAIAGADVVVVETYPSEYHDRLGLELEGGKRHQHHRRNNGPALRTWARRADVDLSDELRFQIDDGFGREGAGEHAFDAVVGLFGMIDVLRDDPSPGIPDDPAVRTVEGWIFGQAPDA